MVILDLMLRAPSYSRSDILVRPEAQKELALKQEANFNLLTYHCPHWAVNSLGTGPMIYSPFCSKHRPRVWVLLGFEYIFDE